MAAPPAADDQSLGPSTGPAGSTLLLPLGVADDDAGGDMAPDPDDDVCTRVVTSPPARRERPAPGFGTARIGADESPSPQGSVSTGELRIPLEQPFRFNDGPVYSSRAQSGRKRVQTYVPGATDARDFAHRLRSADSGTFLVTGYRGVGKTTFVVQAVDAAVVESGPGEKLLDVWLPMARPMTPTELLHHILRRVYQRVDEEGLLGGLPAATREDLVLAVSRTSMALARTSTSSSELGASLGLPGFLDKILPGLGGEKGLSVKAARSLALTSSYLTYDDKEAELDLCRISSAFREGSAAPRGWARRLIDWAFGRQAARVPIKLVLVIDELDKLEVNDSGLDAVEAIFSSLKNLFVASGIVFVLIAGRGFFDRWRRDVRRGQSVYESIVAHDVYVACRFDTDAARNLLGPALQLGDLTPEHRAFLRAIEFHGRGLPRLMMRELSRFVRQEPSGPAVVLSRAQLRVAKFYALLQAAIDHAVPAAELSADLAANGADRVRLGMYYLVDWVLQRSADSFNLEELQRAARELDRSVLDAVGVDAGVAEAVLKMLHRRGIIERVNETGAAISSYRLQVWVRLQLRMDPDRRVASPPERARTLRVGDLLLEIGVDAPRLGGFSRVHRAIEVTTRKAYALKMIAGQAVDHTARGQMLAREVGTLRRVKSLAAFPVLVAPEAWLDGEVGYVMEWIEGRDLADVLRALGARKVAFTQAELARLGYEVAAALAALHEKRLFRIDVSPKNVMVDPAGRVRIIDLGTTLGLEDDEGTAQVIRDAWTRGYEPPERLENPDLIGPPADLYALGKLLLSAGAWEMPAVLQCLNTQPSGRPHARELMEALAPLAAECTSLLRISEIAAGIERENEDAQDIPTGTARRPPESADAPDSAPLKAAIIAIVTAGRTPGDEWPGSRRQPVAILTEPRSGMERLVYGPICRIGRLPLDNDIVAESPSVSREHARIVVEADGSLTIQDLNSRSGTFVDRVAVTGTAALRDGCVIQLGEWHACLHAIPSPSRSANTALTGVAPDR